MTFALKNVEPRVGFEPEVNAAITGSIDKVAIV
jgi:hypothetical protein